MNNRSVSPVLTNPTLDPAIRPDNKIACTTCPSAFWIRSGYEGKQSLQNYCQMLGVTTYDSQGKKLLVTDCQGLHQPEQ